MVPEPMIRKTDEYPASLIERIEGINFLFDNMEGLKQIIERCQSMLDQHK